MTWNHDSHGHGGTQPDSEAGGLGRLSVTGGRLSLRLLNATQNLFNHSVTVEKY